VFTLTDVKFKGGNVMFHAEVDEENLAARIAPVISCKKTQRSPGNTARSCYRGVCQKPHLGFIRWRIESCSGRGS